MDLTGLPSNHPSTQDLEQLPHWNGGGIQIWINNTVQTHLLDKILYNWGKKQLWVATLY